LRFPSRTAFIVFTPESQPFSTPNGIQLSAEIADSQISPARLASMLGFDSLAEQPMENTIRWGILGTGNIAGQFVRGLKDARNAQAVAVGSRSMEKAAAFAREFEIPQGYGSYAELVHDPNVNVIYVATPHALHHENTLMCLQAGKAVLCEKPLAIDEQQAREMIDLAHRKNLFLMEATWTWFLPPFVKLRQLLADKILGRIRFVSADFGFKMQRDPNGRLFDPTLGGGSLLDVGIYPISLATMILGRPAKVTGEAIIGPTGVDEQAAITLRYENGALASLFSAIQTRTYQHAGVFGSEGYVHCGTHWWKGGPMLVTVGEKTERIDEPVVGNGYQYEADEVAQCLHAGEIQSDVVTWDHSLTVLNTMDRLRDLWGLKYPME
jgi:predicted dehydrogenase